MHHHFRLSDLYDAPQKIDLLQSAGLKVREENYSMSYPVYHNDMEYEDVKVWAVYKGGEQFHCPGGYSFLKEDWLNAAFDIVMAEALFKAAKGAL